MNLLKTTLDNGLTVLARESHTAPVTSFWVWYRVGSRNEKPGITGISHWVEHMLFKGTKRWPRRKLDQAIAREGSYLNAMTWYDFTAFYETLPSNKINLALDIESDRMANSLFDPTEVASERSVIISERQGRENSPLFRLEEKLAETAYHVHPYRHQVIGYQRDLESMTRADLYQHYRTYYTPNNALLAVAGDFNAGEMIRVIERHFEGLAPGPAVPEVKITEPIQQSERRVTVEGAGNTDYLNIAYHIPAATHPDIFPLTVLSVALAGSSGSLIGRGSLTNHTSRLYRAIVTPELAADISASLIPTVDPGLYQLSATVLPGHTTNEVATVILQEIERVQQHPISVAEIEKAKQQARALFAFSSESISGQAFWLGFSEIFASYSWFLRYLQRLEAVTAEDVLRVAQTYLQPENRTVGEYKANHK
ncbi:MAG: insulinase family protein [Anaerolineae bacterium]|nr:insulinase family protein [Anaerolineae bacterium]